MKKRFLALALALLLPLCACSSMVTDNLMGSVGEMNDWDYTRSETGAGFTGDQDGGHKSSESYGQPQAALPDPGRKLIRTADIEAETKGFDQALADINVLLVQFGGYTDASERSNGSTYSGRNARWASLTLRIPAESFDSFLYSLGSSIHVNSQRIGSQDVTDVYFDTEARLKSLRIMEERLLVMLEKAEDLATMLELEKSLQETRYEIESLSGTLRKYDGLVSYSTVRVSLREVLELTENPVVNPTLGQRIASQFSASVKGLAAFGAGLLVFLAGNSPVLLLLAGIIVLIIFLLRKGRKRKAAARDTMPPQSSYGYPPPQAQSAPPQTPPPVSQELQE